MLNSNSHANVQIELYNNLGQKVSNLFNSNVSQGENKIELTLPNLSTGVYLLKAKYNNVEKTGNIIVK